jgi:hypothetical protein
MNKASISDTSTDAVLLQALPNSLWSPVENKC